MTGGRLGLRVPASLAAEMIEKHLVPRVRTVFLNERDLLSAYAEASARGVRGGAIYDYLHLAAAQKTNADRIFTLNLGDFKAFRRPGDPEISSP